MPAVSGHPGRLAFRQAGVSCPDPASVLVEMRADGDRLHVTTELRMTEQGVMRLRHRVMHLRRLTEAWTTTATACQSTPSQGIVGGPDSYWQSFAYDTAGNRKTDTVHTPAGDTVRDYTNPQAGTPRPHSLTRRETRGGGAATDYTYDTAGNLASRTHAAGTDTPPPVSDR